MAKKTIGTTTLAATGGASIIGIALATLIVKLIPADIGTDGFAALAVVLSALCGLGAGYLSPSKAEALAPYLAPSADEVAAKVAEVAPTVTVPSADEVAEAVASKVNTTETASYVGQHALSTETPAAVEPAFQDTAEATTEEAYPDLDALAKVGTV
ncbi:hypothetical protein [Kocuria sp. TGY1127_2]|uniref:hypothetical protein n=1 Tax=Kocuria sp. TGY1127_2 TaxID=2711328 RepID=UPI0015BD123E|nr:hypothetical protein [Kocuria sp. TGY1127_2]